MSLPCRGSCRVWLRTSRMRGLALVGSFWAVEDGAVRAGLCGRVRLRLARPNRRRPGLGARLVNSSFVSRAVLFFVVLILLWWFEGGNGCPGPWFVVVGVLVFAVVMRLACNGFVSWAAVVVLCVVPSWMRAKATGSAGASLFWCCLGAGVRSDHADCLPYGRLQCSWSLQ